MPQNKLAEIQFFNRHANADEYNVFTDASKEKIVATMMRLGQFQPGEQVVDLGCGTGIFTQIMQRKYGLCMSGLDISSLSMERAQREYPEIPFMTGDVEQLPFEDNSFDGITLVGVVHHFPQPERFLDEVYRVLKPGKRFVAFDPNRRNPFFYLYRDPSSPLYSPIGVTENERPIVASQVIGQFEQAGFHGVGVEYLSGLHYRYIASSLMSYALPIYNKLDDILFSLPMMSAYSSFVLTYGEK
jgi:ubiquinone/menaquinone biosynthesis C-methylase UbiE